MRKKSPFTIKRLAIYGIIAVVGYALIFQGGFSLGQGTGFEIKLPPPDYDNMDRFFVYDDDFTGYDSAPLLSYKYSSGSSGFITCNVVQEVYPKNTGASLYEKKYSSNDYRATALPLTLLDDGKSVSSFLTQVKMKCDDKYGEIKLKSANIQTDVTAKSKDGKKSIQIGSSASTAGFRTLTEDYNQVIGTGGFVQFEMEDKLKQQVGSLDYTTKFRFEASGTVELYYDSNPSKIYTYKINTYAIPVEFNVKVQIKTQVDTDGDGILDQWDQCDLQKETINGYRDDDGCPDSPPQIQSDPTDENSPDAPKTNDAPTQCNPPNTIVNGNCTPPQNENNPETILNGKMMYQVRTIFQDGGYNNWQIIEGGIFPVELSLLTETGSSDDRPIKSLQIRAYLTLNDDFETTASSMKPSSKIQFMGNTYDLGEWNELRDYRNTSASNFVNTMGANLGYYNIELQQIDAKIVNDVPDKLDPTDITITPAIHGTVKIRIDGTNTYNVQIVDELPSLTLKYSKGTSGTTGGTSGTTSGTTGGTGGTTSGTTGGTGTGGTSGTYTGGTYGSDGDAPIISGGGLGNICLDSTIEQCAIEVTENPMTLIVWIIVGIVVIGLIGGAINKRQQYIPMGNPY